MANFSNVASESLLEILTIQCCVPATITPFHRDPRLSALTELVSVPDLSETGGVIKYKKQTRWPDFYILFETDADYQNKVSFEIICVKSGW